MNLRAVFALAAFSMAVCAPGRAEKPKYPLTVHVESSDYSASCNPNYACYGLQKLTVTIEGKKYILASEDAAEYHRVIEMQVADGVAKRYTVVGELGN